MKLIVGLGNPGKKYENTRHNAGFIVLDHLAKQHGFVIDLDKYSAFYSKSDFLGVPCVFVKPQTFMNLSGKSVQAFMQFYKIEPSDLIVLHDDVDVEAGKVKARVGGGAGGHNGIRSIIQVIGSGDFHRIKLGIGKPGPGEYPTEVVDWVLAPFHNDQLTALTSSMYDSVIDRIKGIFLNPKVSAS